jgi:hypothetical protein
MDASTPSAASSPYSVVVTTNTREDCSAMVTQNVDIQDDVTVYVVMGGATNSQVVAISSHHGNATNTQDDTIPSELLMETSIS